MRVALGQLGSLADVGANLASVAERVARAAEDGADLLVLPEFAMYDKPVVDETFADVAEPLDGPFVRAVGALAAEHGVNVALGVVERSDERRPWNTVALLGRDGSLLGRWRKAQLFDAYGYAESRSIRPAEDLTPHVVDLEGTPVGFLVCYDLRFPEVARGLVRAGARLVVAPSAWVPGPTKVAQWRTLLAARAIENVCHVVGVCQAAPVSTGTSLACAPDGTVLAELGPAPGQVVVDLPAGAVDAARERDRNVEVARLGR
ncbi:carbon-nitrogen hydrolase family protein [Nocardioides sp. GY 10127]|uniref:carbon-nitrogen hydrolase family protein n=1 Tax=Nocardioides sp. GY 10127 TaxID=2569762 RepID=UPI00145847CD|nr:carbon-nitrogen hydrolase family protein [Nocardioides sp. GY 10127]